MAEKMKIFAPDPTTGKPSETIGENMDILESKEPWSEYVLEDGNKIKAKQAVVNIVKLEQTTPDEAAFGRRFSELYKKWCEETIVDSFIGNPYHKSYDRIVQLGYRVVPYIIAKLKEEPSFMFVVLKRITGENPVKEGNRGNARKMAEDWIEWWEKKSNTGRC